MSYRKSGIIFEQWKISTRWITEHIEQLSDNDFFKPVAPGRNTAYWLLGHLTLVEDRLSEYMGFEPMYFPQYEELFDTGSSYQEGRDDYPSLSTLHENWKKVIKKNKRILPEIPDKEWSQPHARTSEKNTDFLETKEDCLLRWALHQTYHNGQLGLLVASLQDQD